MDKINKLCNFHSKVQDIPASMCKQIQLFCCIENNEYKQMTFVSYTPDKI